MRIGPLRHRITLKSVATTPSPASGEPSETEAVMHTAYAAIEPLRGREFHEARSNNSEVDVRIRMRYHPGVTAKLRVYFGARRYDIQAVIDLYERHHELHLMCKEYTDGR